MIIVGMTACGKTHYMLKMLEENYKGHFDYIFIVCPTIAVNTTYQNWKYIKDPDIFTIGCSHDEVDSYLRDIAEFVGGTNSLIILDDCAKSQNLKSGTSEMVNLTFSGTFITQQLTSIVKPYRVNVMKLVTFCNACRDDTKYIFNYYLNVDKSEEKRIIKHERKLPMLG